MGDKPPSSSDLVRTFLESTEAAFRFLEVEPDFQRAVTILAATPSGFVPATPEEIGPHFFWAEVKMVTTRLAVTLNHGDREYLVESLVEVSGAGRDGVVAYALWEWGEALGDPDARHTSVLWARQPEGVRAAVHTAGRVLQTHLSAIRDPSAHLRAVLLRNRQQRMEEEREREAKREHDRLAALAGEAFRERRYAQVVDLLSPIERRLSPSERKKLDYARNHIS